MVAERHSGGAQAAQLSGEAERAEKRLKSSCKDFTKMLDAVLKEV